MLLSGEQVLLYRSNSRWLYAKMLEMDFVKIKRLHIDFTINGGKHFEH